MNVNRRAGGAGAMTTSSRRSAPPESAAVTTKVVVSPVTGFSIVSPARATGVSVAPDLPRRPAEAS
jgi:hypothetical protein